MSEALRLGLETFQQEFEQALAAKPDATWRTAGRKTKANPNGEDADWWRTAGRDMVTAYYTWRQNNRNLQVWDTPTGVPAIELEVKVRLQDGTVVQGFIDRIFQDFDSGELLIVDLKSGSNTPAPVQLAVYRMMVEQTFGYSPKFGAYWMARQGSLDAIHDLDRIPPVVVSRWMRDVRKMIDQDIYVPHVSRMCGYCGVREDCYAHTPDASFVPDFDSDIR